MKLKTYLIIATVVCTSPLIAGEYRIKVDRPCKTGDKYRLEGTGSLSRHLKIATESGVLKEAKVVFSATFEGIITVKKTTAKGAASELSVKVVKCQKQPKKGEKYRDLLPKGSKIIVMNVAGNTEYLVGDKQASEDVSELLALFINLKEYKHSNEDIYGTSELQKIGGTWKVNQQKLAEILTPSFLVSPKDLNGKSSLGKVVTVGKRKCLRINSAVTSTAFSMGSVPPFMKVLKSELAMKNSEDLPIDAELGPLSRTTSMDVHLEAKGKQSRDAPGMQLVIKTKITQKSEFTYLN